MEAMSRSSLCVQNRNENDSDIPSSFSLWNFNLPIIVNLHSVLNIWIAIWIAI